MCMCLWCICTQFFRNRELFREVFDPVKHPWWYLLRNFTSQLYKRQKFIQHSIQHNFKMLDIMLDQMLDELFRSVHFYPTSTIQYSGIFYKFYLQLKIEIEGWAVFYTCCVIWMDGFRWQKRTCGKIRSWMKKRSISGYLTI